MQASRGETTDPLFNRTFSSRRRWTRRLVPDARRMCPLRNSKHTTRFAGGKLCTCSTKWQPWVGVTRCSQYARSSRQSLMMIAKGTHGRSHFCLSAASFACQRMPELPMKCECDRSCPWQGQACQTNQCELKCNAALLRTGEMLMQVDALP